MVASGLLKYKAKCLMYLPYYKVQKVNWTHKYVIAPVSTSKFENKQIPYLLELLSQEKLFLNPNTQCYLKINENSIPECQSV